MFQKLRSALLLITVSATALCAPAAMAATCSGPAASVSNASTDDVRLKSFDSDACVVSGVNPHQYAGNSSGFSGVFPAGGSWSVLGGFGADGTQDIASAALGGVNFSFSFARDSGGKSGTWAIMADKNVTMDLVFAMHASNRSGSFFFDNESLVANSASNGTWKIEWHNAGGNVPGYSNLVVFGRDVSIITPPPPPPPPPNPTAIPEPETYAMLLAGLGLMGFVVRRRRSGADR